MRVLIIGGTKFGPYVVRQLVAQGHTVTVYHRGETEADLHLSRQVPLLIMDVSRRAWKGSERARAFYARQQRLWEQMLREFPLDQSSVEAVLQLFQGAVLAYLITDHPEPGHRCLARFFSNEHSKRRTARRATRPAPTK